MQATGPVPRLVVTLRSRQSDAYEISRALYDLDLACRRAGATLAAYREGRGLDYWAFPYRPERTGLLIVDSRIGSWEAAAAFYGMLAMLATSSPVSIASLIALSWQAGAGTRRAGQWLAGRLGNRSVTSPLEVDPSPSNYVTWGIGQTKALEPVMLEAATSGHGFEFVNNYQTGEVRLTVYPADIDES